MKPFHKLRLYTSILAAFIAVFFFILYQEYKYNLVSNISFFESFPLLFENIYVKIIDFKFNPSFFNRSLVALFHFISIFLFTYLLLSFFEYIKILSERKIIYNAFSHYVNPRIAEAVLSDPKSLNLGGKNMEITVYFIDIKNFSYLLEIYSPQDVVQYLNNYFSEMAHIILKNNGTVDKYDGDAIMAFWGAPTQQEDHALFACKTALEQQKRLLILRKKWKKENMPQLKADIAIASGNMVVGNIGSKGHFNYTVIGEGANVCFEIEQFNKIYGTNILATEETYHLAKNKFEFREIQKVKLRNKKYIKIFELLSAKGKLKPPFLKLRDSYHEALGLFQMKTYSEAQKAINNCLKLVPNDKPSLVLKNKIDQFISKTKGQ